MEEHLGDNIDPMHTNSPQEEIMHCDDLDDVRAESLVDTQNVTSDKAAGIESRCWRHGCNGRKFSTHSNLIRHQVEKGKARPNFVCPVCGAYFSRTTARNQHMINGSCSRIRRYSNGRERPRPRVITVTDKGIRCPEVD
jgi:hypothetical protein